MELSKITGLSQYLMSYGGALAHKAIASQNPLHVPGVDRLPDFSRYSIEPFEAQKHVIAALSKLLCEQGAALLSGQMGVGKTIVSMCIVDSHAQLSRNRGGKGGKYRCAVICPDHIIEKWCREIQDTIPDAVVFRFNSWRDFAVLSYARRATGRHGDARNEIANGARWMKPQGPEFYVMGRNQIKFYPKWRGIGSKARLFGGKLREHVPRRVVVVDRKAKQDEHGNIVYGPADKWGYRQPVMQTITEKVPCCPRCGKCPTSKQNVPVGFESLSKTKQQCDGLIMRELPSDRHADGLDVFMSIPPEVGRTNLKPGSEFNFGGKRWTVEECGEPLWSFTSKPMRWPGSRIIHSRMRKFFDYLIVDEAHEHKSDESAQSMAMGKVLAAADKCVMMTGTFIGGYAHHLFPMLFRACPEDLIDMNFEWGRMKPFAEQYGIMDRIDTTVAPAEVVVSSNTSSMRKARVGKTKSERDIRPGIMPTLFGRVLQPHAAFLTLEEMADELPDLEDSILPGMVELPLDIHLEYKRVEQALANKIRELGPSGGMKLCGTMLQTLLSYPDHPWDWDPMFEGEHAVGYWQVPKVYKKENWNGVVSPFNFNPDDIILPKERRLIEICRAAVEQGRQVWVYCQMTKKRNVMPRLQKLLMDEGMATGILNSDDVKPIDREAWIAANGTKYQVMLSHPKLVGTGLDLFSKEPGGHNYSTLVFFQTGYNLFDLKQAARRAWRIGQPLDCQVFYLHYRGTMQQRALMLMSRKAAALQQLEGDTMFSEDSLAAMSGDSSAQMALVRTLSEHIDEGEIARNWAKVSGTGRKKAARPKPSAKQDTQQSKKPRVFNVLEAPPELYDDAGVPRPGEPSPFDKHSVASQAVLETLHANPKGKTTAEIVAEVEAKYGTRPELRIVRDEEEEVASREEVIEELKVKAIEEVPEESLDDMLDDLDALLDLISAADDGDEGDEFDF